MSIGFWVIAGVILLLVGNLMAAKPKIHETRLDKLRTLARQHQLYPKLIPSPEWLKSSTPMIAQYSKINDEWRLPALKFVLKEHGWQALDDTHHVLPIHCNELESYICAISMKANSISIFWHDETYARQFAAHDKEANNTIQRQLEYLSCYLDNVAKQYQPTK